MNGKVTYRQQYTRCGKQRCRKCKESAGHGPYWYAYWSDNGRTISKYIGIHPPSEIEQAELQTLSTASNKHVPVAKLAKIAAPQETSLSPDAMSGIATRDLYKKQARAVPSATEAQPHLRVYLLGQFCVERKENNAWQTVANRTWQRRRARALLGCLLSHAGRRMGREQVMEALWPDLDIDTAANRLNGAVHELRQILEPDIERPAASKLLRLERDILILADSSQIWVDAEAFESLLNRANTTQDSTQIEEILEEAAALYGGDYLLEELYSEWAASRRESLRRGWMGLLLELAELRAARNALTSAIEPLDRLLTADPTHETAVRRLMVLLTQLDRRGEAIRAYQRLTAILKRDYENDPLPETMELYQALRQGQIQASHPITGPLPSPAPTPPSTEPKMKSQGQREERHSTSTSTLKQSASAPLVSPHSMPRPFHALGRQNQSPLIGRQREMETMQQVLMAIHNLPARPANKGETREHAHTSNMARFVMLLGETGIGKTRLAEELSHKALAGGWLVAWTRAYEQEGTIPYRPWTDILRTLLQDIPLERLLSLLEGKASTTNDESAGTFSPMATAHARLARLAVLLPELTTHPELHLQQNRLPVPTAPEQERFHLWEATLSLLSALSQSAPLLIVLDDLHWTDDSSLELLAYLARHRQNERVMLLTTCRDIELAPSASLRSLLNDLRREQILVTLPLQPLSQVEIGHLISSHLPHELVRRIQSQAGGNPLFAEELARFSETAPGETPKEYGNGSLPGGREDTVGTNHSTPLPETIAAVLERRLKRLSGDCQILLSKAAVLGGSFEFSLLMRMTGDGQTNEDSVLDLLEEAMRSGLLSEEVNGARIVYHFWHPLIISHLYEHISAARRAQLHRRAALALIELHVGNEAEIAPAIVYHLSKYGQEKQLLANYAEIAGSQAMALSAYTEALHYYRQALDAWKTVYSTLPAEEQDSMHIAHLLECMAECNAIQGNFPEARAEYHQALELHRAQKVDVSEFARPEEFLAWQQEEAQVQSIIWQDIGQIWNSVGEYTQAHKCIDQGKEVLEEARVMRISVARAGMERLDGIIYLAEGNFAEARRHVEASLAIYKESMLNLQRQEAQEGRSPLQKRTRTTLPIPRSRRALGGDPQILGRVMQSLGIICANAGLHSEAVQHFYAALAIFEKQELVSEMAKTCSNIGAAHATRGEHDLAISYLKRSLGLVELTGDVLSKALVMGNLGEIAAHDGNLQDAEVWLKDGVKMAAQISFREGLCWCLDTLSYVQQDLGKFYHALKKIRRSIVVGRDMKSTLRVSFSLVALAEWRITQAIIAYNNDPQTRENTPQSYTRTDLPFWRQRLQSAKAAVERALTMEDIQAETNITARLALATIHYLQGDIDLAYQQTLHVLKEASQSEAARQIARSQRLFGQIQAARGFEDEAISYFEQALVTCKKYGQRLDYARTLLRYGISLLQGSQSIPTLQTVREQTANQATYEQGMRRLYEARDIFKESQARTELQWTELTLTTSNYSHIRI